MCPFGTWILRAHAHSYVLSPLRGYSDYETLTSRVAAIAQSPWDSQGLSSRCAVEPQSGGSIGNSEFCCHRFAAMCPFGT